ncbi:alpha/beta fold hydrolase [uncultured Pseudokineococcus sp.]|uniref:alpha/beta fold hydrolase n=1 Tax=uncultured Pseudokineococcus sp. TaxID=1642928 RepID=UPI00261F635A|nr:alpha/beta fold hydrolase [uncultured Pseudokineococcus sp.]
MPRPPRTSRTPGGPALARPRLLAGAVAVALALVALPTTGLLQLPGALGGDLREGAAAGTETPALVPDPVVEAVPDAERPLLVLRAEGDDVVRATELPRAVARTAVLVLHGYTSSAAQAAERLEAAALARDLGAVVVLPTGLGERPSWAAGSCCGSAARSDVDDVGYLSRLLADLRSRGAERAYVVGYSNGGMLAYRLACERPEDVDAVAVVNGTVAVPTCPGAFTALHLAGAEDDAVPVDGVDLVPFLFTGFPALADLPALAPAADLDVRVLSGVGHEVAPGVPATVRRWLAAGPTPPA